MKKYDVIIMVTKKHINMLKKMLPYSRINIPVNEIYIVGPISIANIVSEIPNVNYIQEDTIYDGLNYKNISQIIGNRCGDSSRTGWYLQQFLKMAWAYKCEDDKYITLDADTFILNPIAFENDDGKYCFTPKIEYHKPYFDTIDKLFNGNVKKEVDFSFIAENMIFDKKIMLKMISEIENNSDINGSKFFEKIINAVPLSALTGSGFSEFETYGNYIAHYHPKLLYPRKLRTMRESVQILGSNPTKSQLEWASKDYDIISIETENYPHTMLTRFTSKRIVQKIIPMRVISHIRWKIRHLYRALINKQDFIFESY